MKKLLFCCWMMLFPLCMTAGNGGVADSLGAEFQALPDTARISFLLRESFAKMYVNPDWALRCVEHGLEIADASGLEKRRTDLILQRGTVRWAKSDYSGAQTDYTEAKRQFAEREDSMGIAKADNNLGLVFWSQSYYDLALEAHLRALTYFERHPDTLRLAVLYNNIGNIYNRTRNAGNAEEYYRKAYDLLKRTQDTDRISMVANNLALVLEAQKESKEAMQLYEVALKGYRSTGNISGESSVLTNMGSAFIHSERWDEARNAYETALVLAEKVGNPYDMAVSHLKMAEFHVKTRDFAAAVVSGTRSLEFGKGPGSIVQLASTHETLSAAYEGLGEHVKALAHYKDFKALQDSIFNENKSRAVAELQLKYDTAVKDQQIERLSQQRQLAQLRIVVLIVLIALIVITATLIYLRQRAVLRREKLLQEKDRAVYEAQQALHEAQLRVSNAEKQRLKDEIDFKSREITTLAMNIVRRNELLETLDQELKLFRKAAKEGGEEKIRDISLMLAQSLSSDKERKEIEMFIDEAQQNFFLELDRRFAGLSQKDKRLCGMIRQGLSSKEIAAVFNINTASVEVSRYRLRKKLGLDGSQDLQAYLGEF